MIPAIHQLSTRIKKKNRHDNWISLQNLNSKKSSQSLMLGALKYNSKLFKKSQSLNHLVKYQNSKVITLICVPESFFHE